MARLKITILSFVMALTLLSPQAFCDDLWQKAGRGASNFLFGFMEVPHQIQEMGKENDNAIAFLGGIIKGSVLGATRMVAGVVEVVTFPLPFPRHDYKPIMRPRSVLSETYPAYEDWPRFEGKAH